MQVKKELSFLFVFILFTALLTGCTDISTITLQEDGSGCFEEVLTLSADTWQLLLGNVGSDELIKEQFHTLYPGSEVSIEDHVIDDIQTKMIRLKIDFANKDDFQKLLNPYGVVSVKYNNNYYSRSTLSSLEDAADPDDSADSLIQALESLLDENQDLLELLTKELDNMQVKTTITFPYTVIKSNGSIQDDSKTVLWDLDQLNQDAVSSKGSRTYALFQEQNAQKSPKVRGAKDGKCYNTGITLYVDSENLLDHVIVNGQAFETDYLSLSKEGTYHIKAIDINKNETSIRFLIDTTKPLIRGVSQNKIYHKARTIKFSDKGSGIKKATLNGKTIKSGKKVVQKGTYLLKVADHAGNQKTIKFEIR